MAYKAVIGLEFHCEMKSHTKVFSDAINGYSKKSNEYVRPIDVAFPGTLPMVNKECVRKAIEAAMILNCEIPDYMEFDRKHYFYPDLPKGYQLTQFFHPVGIKGKLNIDVNGTEKEVLIHDIHLEEDAASLDHYYNTSNIDYNRAGVPLLELVTEPCLHSADEALAFLETMRSIYQYTDISDCDTKKGQIRADVNVSIMEEDAKEFGTKVEVKNVNSFDAINGYAKLSNEYVRPLDVAFPGTLPMVNKECVKKAIEAAIILNCKLPEYMEFDRKHYFYPDLPKGYQLTQFFNPVGTHGKIEIDVNGKKKEVLIHDIHLEEDAASLDHFYDTSNIDYNRAGVPLLELVTEPVFNSSEEALAFLEHMRSIYQYTDISDCDTKKGQIRADVNVSIMDENDTKFGTKVEVKNVNSFEGIKGTIEYEIKRQSELKSSGRYDEVVQETRRWDDETKTTIHMRSKADAIDYKYFTEPNIPRYKITKELVSEIKKNIPLLAYERKEKYVNEYKLSEYDAKVLVKSKKISDYFDECVRLGCDPKSAVNWITTRVLAEVNKSEDITIDDVFIRPNMIVELCKLIEDKKITNNQGKEVFAKMLEEHLTPSEIVKKYEMEVIEDSNLIDTFVDEVLSENEKAIIDYKNGRTNMLDYLVGQVMKKSKGKANPVEAKTKMLEKIK